MPSQKKPAKSVRSGKKTTAEPKKISGYPVYCQPWVESERGWGQNPDGFSLHFSQDHLTRYINKVYAGRKGPAPDVYVKAEGLPYIVIVSERLFRLIKKEGGSLRSYDNLPSPVDFLE